MLIMVLNVRLHLAFLIEKQILAFFYIEQIRLNIGEHRSRLTVLLSFTFNTLFSLKIVIFLIYKYATFKNNLNIHLQLKVDFYGPEKTRNRIRKRAEQHAGTFQLMISSISCLFTFQFR